MKLLILLVLNFSLSWLAMAQQAVQFISSDKVKINADCYKSADSNPYVILLHQEDASRGEYEEIAPRIIKLGYNCLAVDLRYGGKYGYTTNETHEYLKLQGINSEAYDARKDILAAIDYAFNISHKPVILFGSSFSASLSLLIGKSNPRVKAVIGFSPGEFFGARISVKDSLTGFSKPVFLASSKAENSFVTDLSSKIPTVSKTCFSPSYGMGMHGAKCLTKICSDNNEYWLALLLFFRDLED